MTFRELYSKLDKMFPRELSCDWDNDGIMCMPAPDNEVRRLLISLDITGDVVDFAIKNGFDTIVSHHPLVFKAQQSLSVDNYTQGKLIKLVKNDINVMSFHTRLDAAMGGVNDTLCKLLGLESATVDKIDPIGRIAILDAEASLEDFSEFVKETLGSNVVLFSGNKPVKKVYVCGGDGKDMIPSAIANGADTLLTGRASYNTMVDAEDMGLNIIEAGHFYTEDPVCATLKFIISDLDSSAEISSYSSNNIRVIK